MKMRLSLWCDLIFFWGWKSMLTFAMLLVYLLTRQDEESPSRPPVRFAWSAKTCRLFGAKLRLPFAPWKVLVMRHLLSRKADRTMARAAASWESQKKEVVPLSLICKAKRSSFCVSVPFAMEKPRWMGLSGLVFPRRKRSLRPNMPTPRLSNHRPSLRRSVDQTTRHCPSQRPKRPPLLRKKRRNPTETMRKRRLIRSWT